MPVFVHQVKVISFYDVVMDFILMDAFDDLENPPSSVTAVVNNRWLSNGFKETVRWVHSPVSFSFCVLVSFCHSGTIVACMFIESRCERQCFQVRFDLKVLNNHLAILNAFRVCLCLKNLT